MRLFRSQALNVVQLSLLVIRFYRQESEKVELPDVPIDELPEKQPGKNRIRRLQPIVDFGSFQYQRRNRDHNRGKNPCWPNFAFDCDISCAFMLLLLLSFS